MGREIRRVTADWKHPVDHASRRGDGFKPLFDGDFDALAKEWIANCVAWENGTHSSLTGEGEPDGKPSTTKAETPYWWDWDGSPPRRENYMLVGVPAELRTHFQIYETVTEGTPVSPVFATKDALVFWLMNDGGEDGKKSRANAEAFAESEWAPSIVLIGNVATKDIDSAAELKPRGTWRV